MIKRKNKLKQKKENWFVRNKKVLYWPLGGIIYFLLVMVVTWLRFGKMPVILKMLFYPLLALVEYVCFPTNQFCANIRYVGVFFLWIIFLLIFGFLHNLLKKKKWGVIVLIVIILLYMMIAFVEYTSRIPLFEL